MEALLIIDMQTGSFVRTARFDPENIVIRINRISEAFRSAGKPVIFVRHDGTKERFLIRGTDEWRILPTLVISDTDIVIDKEANDSFYRSALSEVLSERSVDTLWITGCATDFCVNATVHSALTKDFNLTVLNDCHTTADRPGLTARQIIEFHNFIWENLTPTGGSVRVIEAETALAGLCDQTGL